LRAIEPTTVWAYDGRCGVPCVATRLRLPPTSMRRRGGLPRLVEKGGWRWPLAQRLRLDFSQLGGISCSASDSAHARASGEGRYIGSIGTSLSAGRPRYSRFADCLPLSPIRAYKQGLSICNDFLLLGYIIVSKSPRDGGLRPLCPSRERGQKAYKQPQILADRGGLTTALSVAGTAFVFRGTAAQASHDSRIRADVKSPALTFRSGAKRARQGEAGMMLPNDFYWRTERIS
jgi:hypothetical protein